MSLYLFDDYFDMIPLLLKNNTIIKTVSKIRCHPREEKRN